MLRRCWCRWRGRAHKRGGRGAQARPSGSTRDRGRTGTGRRRPGQPEERAHSRFPPGQVGRTIADGLRTQHLGDVTFAHIRQFVESIS